MWRDDAVPGGWPRRLAAALWLTAAALAVAAVGQLAPVETPSGLGVNAALSAGQPAGEPLTGAELERLTDEVASLMRCPVCQGLSVADSPTESALAMKDEVRDLLAAGYTEEQVLDYFERAYGEFIRLSPKPQGFNLVVWLAPVAAVLAGAGLVVWRLRRRERFPEPVATDEPPEGDDPLDPYLEQVRRETSG